MAQKKDKTIKGGGAKAKDALIGDLASASTPSNLVTPSINIAAYPHILSSILDHSSSTILTTLLRCSKVMLMTVAPRIYRNLRITSKQLAEVLVIAWAPSKRGSRSGLCWESFSPFAKESLQGIRTLHLLDYDSTVEYGRIPRGLFNRCETVVLYPIDAMYRDDYLALSFPTTFTSLFAPDIYVRLSESAVRLKSKGPRIIRLMNLPRTVKSLTFLIPLACLLPYPPLCDFRGGYCDTTFVLLPWLIEEEGPDFTSSLLDRWSATHQPLAAGDCVHTRIFGSEYCGISNAMQRTLGFPQRLPTSPHNSFSEWIYRELRSRTVFQDSEFNPIISAHGKIMERLGDDRSAELEGYIEQLRAEGTDPRSPVMIQLEERLARNRWLTAEGRYRRAWRGAIDGGAKAEELSSFADFLASGNVM